jgi:hypothetical protein
MKIESNDRGYHFLEWKHGAHNRYSLRLWISESLSKGEEINFPVTNATIRKTQKGGLVLIPKEGDVVYLASMVSGFRGSAGLTVMDGGEEMAQVYYFHSGQGRIGETAFALINGKMTEPVLVKWRKSGRRVDKTSGIWRLTADGLIEDVIDDPEVCSLLSE